MKSGRKMERLSLIRKRGQIWGLDLMAAAVIFSVTVGIFYFYALNESSGATEMLELLSYDGRLISENILSEGVPSDWDAGNVVEIGILTDGKINETKASAFYSLVQADYERTKLLLNTRYDYYFFLDEQIDVTSAVVDGIGKPGSTRDNIDPDNLIKIGRVAVYDGKPTGATLYVWK
jgi:hypothetical protein